MASSYPSSCRHSHGLQTHVTRMRPRARGTADIELIASIGVLMTFLGLAVGVVRVAIARIDMARTAQFEAQQDATAAASPQYANSSSVEPIEGLDSIRPGLPNRTHVPKPTKDVTLKPSKEDQSTTVTIGGKAALAGPAWIYTAYPVGGNDESQTEQWFSGYVGESVDPIRDPLRLAPSWNP